MIFSLFHGTIILLLCFSEYVICGEYQSFGGKSYYMEKNAQENWQSANNICRRLWNGEGQLAMVTSEEENNFIYNYFGKSWFGSIWIGGNDIKHEGVWVWSNNCTLDNSVKKLWKNGEPNNQGNENCLHIWGRYSGLWNDIDCDNKYNFVCEKVTKSCTYLGPNIAKGKSAAQSKTESNGEARRATDGVISANYFDNGCTHTGTGNQNWLVIDLGEIHTVIGIKLINRQDCCAERLQNFTVSLSYEDRPTFKPDDLQPTNADQCIFQRDAVGAEITIDCKGLTGRYVVITKNDILTLCEVEVFGTVNPKIKYFNKQVYQVETRNLLTWAEASQFCKTLWNGNGRLVNVESVAENSFLVEQFKAEQYNVWLGGNDLRHEGFFAWSNGCPVQDNIKNTLWNVNQPDNCCTGENCMHLNVGNKDKWNDIDCNLRMSFVCERESAAQQCNYLGPNIAFGKKAWQSSETFGGSASRATDGNTNQDYYVGQSCSHAENDGRNFLFIDLENFYNVTHVELFNRLDCCTERLSDFAVSVGHIADKDRSNLKFNGLVPIGFQLCHYQKEAVGSSILISCNSKIGQQIAIVKPSNILTLCEVKVYGYKISNPPMVCNDNSTQYKVGDKWREESKCQDFICTINGVEIFNTDCRQDGKCYAVGQNFSDDTNCVKMRCEDSENLGMKVTERGCRSDDQCKSHAQSFLETSTCKNLLCNNGTSELQETGCRLDGACIKNKENLFDKALCRTQQCQNGTINLITQGCPFRNSCVEQDFEFYDNKTCALYRCSPIGKMKLVVQDCHHDDGCLKVQPNIPAVYSMVIQPDKDESCKVERKKYDICRCVSGLLIKLSQDEVTSAEEYIF